MQLEEITYSELPAYGDAIEREIRSWGYFDTEPKEQ